MSADIGVIMQLLQRQMALVPPAYSAVSSPPQVTTLSPCQHVAGPQRSFSSFSFVKTEIIQDVCAPQPSPYPGSGPGDRAAPDTMASLSQVRLFFIISKIITDY